MLSTREIWSRKFRDEWERMVRDPLFTAYGGDRSDSARARYIERRFAEIRHYNRHNRALIEALAEE